MQPLFYVLADDCGVFRLALVFCLCALLASQYVTYCFPVFFRSCGLTFYGECGTSTTGCEELI
jgi:hypothetical protein